MSTDPKFVELTPDGLNIYIYIIKCWRDSVLIWCPTELLGLILYIQLECIFIFYNIFRGGSSRLSIRMLYSE